MLAANCCTSEYKNEKKRIHHGSNNNVDSENIVNMSICELIPDLCKQFYGLGWLSGTGGGISIKSGAHIFVTPSGVQKEKILPEEMFILSEDGDKVIKCPDPKLGLKLSECLPLFMSAYRLRGAGAVI